ncbi:malate dehydrogenase [Rhizobium etli CNPAF512]|nr:malate dehydrogenase [Rhizobium etli CNPAF512]
MRGLCLGEVGRREGGATIDTADHLLPSIAACRRKADAHPVAVFIFKCECSALSAARRSLRQHEFIAIPFARSRRRRCKTDAIELVKLVSLIRSIEAEDIAGFERDRAVAHLAIALLQEEPAEQRLAGKRGAGLAFTRPRRRRHMLLSFPDTGKGAETEMSGGWCGLEGHDCSQPLIAATIFLAASSRSSAAVIARPDSFRIFLPSSTLVPSRRTTSGTLRPTSLTAAMTPSAMTSHFMMPPKMLTRMPSTLGSAVMILKAAATFSLPAPPPTSQKLAGSLP